MADHDFLFALDISGEADTRMLGELCTALNLTMDQKGLTPELAELINDRLNKGF